jgi:glucose/arabinose dehydrogenase
LVLVVQATSTATASSLKLTTADGVQLQAAVVADGLEEITDLAVAPDGRMYLAERPGRIRVFRAGQLMLAPALTLRDATTAEGHGLLALTLDPRFDQNHLLYAVYTTAEGFRVARFRAVGDTLGDRAILMDAVPARATRPAASLRFGPDAKLYAGFDNAGQAARSGDLGSFNGKILRLNADGTTPADRSSGSPLYGSNLSAPRGLEWDATGTMLWVADGKLDVRGPGGASVARYNLPNDAKAAGLAFYRGDLIKAFRGNLFVVADDGRALSRLTFDAGSPPKVAATEQLVNRAIEGARAVAIGRDGAIYVGTTHSLVKLAP